MHIRGGLTGIDIGGFVERGADGTVISCEGEMMDDVGLYPLPADEADVALLVVAPAAALVSVTADEAGRGCDVVVRVALLAVVEVVKPDSPGPIPMADERRSPKKAIMAWSEISGPLSSDWL